MLKYLLMFNHVSARTTRLMIGHGAKFIIMVKEMKTKEAQKQLANFIEAMEVSEKEFITELLANFIYNNGISECAKLISDAIDEANGAGTEASTYYHREIAKELLTGV